MYNAKENPLFSDTHLSHHLDEAKFAYLCKIISEADEVIINGYFWDYYLTDWENFLQSPWKILFPLLKSKNAIYIFGNHDLKEFSDERVNLFSVAQTQQYTLKASDRIFNIQHGHKIAPGIEQKYPMLNHRRFISTSLKINNFIGSFLGGDLDKAFHKKVNERMKKYAADTLLENEVLICGHSHLVELNEPAPFINSGMIRLGIAQSLIINGDKIELVNARYK